VYVGARSVREQVCAQHALSELVLNVSAATDLLNIQFRLCCAFGCAGRQVLVCERPPACEPTNKPHNDEPTKLSGVLA
jgi:hypothetical protein